MSNFFEDLHPFPGNLPSWVLKFDDLLMNPFNLFQEVLVGLLFHRDYFHSCGDVLYTTMLGRHGEKNW